MNFRLYLTDFFGARRAGSIGFDDLERYKKFRKEAGASRASINRELCIVRRALHLGIKAKKVTSLPVKCWTNLTMSAKVSLRHPTFCAFFRSCRSMFGYICGWRKGEILSLKWTQVDRVSCTITLSAKNSKNKRARTLEYGKNPELCELIEHQWSRKQEIEQSGKRDKIKTVFFHPNGRPIRDFRKSWADACEAAGCEG